MLSDFITPDVIRLNVDCSNWYAAIKAGTDLLVSADCVEGRYFDAIVRGHQTLGPYMVIAPGIMLAHARPEDGVRKMALSLITLKVPLAFGNTTNDPVKLLITLAAVDKNSHLSIMAELMELLMNTEDIDRIIDAAHVDEVIDIVHRYSK